MTAQLSALLSLANHYPSPHNGQPIRVRQTGPQSVEFIFVKERGLQSNDTSFILSFVSMGVFIEHFAISAQALGHTFSYALSLPLEKDLKGKGSVVFASGKLEWETGQPNDALAQILRSRQTSRKKYTSRPAPEIIKRLIALAGANKMRLKQLTPKQAQQAVWLNQRAVFDDLRFDPVRQELDHWLRYSKAEKETKADGLSYDCMELNGGLLKYIIRHPRLVRLPGVSWLLQQYYLRTMKDSSDVLYMMAPFKTEHDSFEVGTVIMQLWLLIAAHGYYLHPFGTIMSNEAAHRDFIKLVREPNESRSDYLVFIFRCGKSAVPPRSARINVTEHLWEKSE